MKCLPLHVASKAMVMDMIIQEEHGDQREKHLGGNLGLERERGSSIAHWEGAVRKDQGERMSPKLTEWNFQK